MAGREHRYEVSVGWTGETRTVAGYSRDHRIRATGKPDIAGSSDPAFRGDAGRWNPEELLVASLSACHKLWFLHLCADAGIVVTAYTDDAVGTMVESPPGGCFTRVVLRPRVTIAAGDPAALDALHHRAHEHCFIARSVNFDVTVEPRA